MKGTNLPLLRGKILRTDLYQSVTGGARPKTPLPVRDRAKHRAYLVAQLDAVQHEIDRRPAGTRVPEASREVIAVQPEAGIALDPDAFTNRASDTRVIAVDEKTGTLLIDTPAPQLDFLRKKIDAFADPAKDTKKSGQPKNAPAIAPLIRVGIASLDDLAADRALLTTLDIATRHWFEVACAGGTREPAAVTERSRKEIRAASQRLGLPEPKEYLATMRTVFLLHCTVPQLQQLVDSVDCVYDFDISSTAVRDWLVQSSFAHESVSATKVIPPGEKAPRVVVIDTGISREHPLLKPLLKSSFSVVPGENSAEDTDGHGTEMAGVAAFDDVGAALGGAVQATHWLESVRIMVDEAHPHAQEDQRPLWPKTAQDAVEDSEIIDDENRVYLTAITGELKQSRPTNWSHAWDRLAYNGGKGRLIVISIGNAPVSEAGFVDGYPNTLFTARIADPAQAINVLTVGAYTVRDTLPPDGSYKGYAIVAPKGGASPNTRTGIAANPDGIKPDVVFEGGNVARDQLSADPTVPTLIGLTTGHDFIKDPLSTINATSEASAHGACFVARLVSRCGGFTRQTIRGLVVHSARWTEAMTKQIKGLDDRLACCGYGVPQLEVAAACAKDRATVIVEESLQGAVVREVTVTNDKGKSHKEQRTERFAKLFRMPLPEKLLMDAGESKVDLRITLSYFAEPNTFRRKVYRGLDLRWEMQGPLEEEADFLRRINKLARGEETPGLLQEDKIGKKPKTKPFKWTLGIKRRSRGTVQSDWWSGPAASLAGAKLVAVYPALGWWDGRDDTRQLMLPFSLIVSVHGPGIDLYGPIKVELEAPIVVEV